VKLSFAIGKKPCPHAKHGMAGIPFKASQSFWLAGIGYYQSRKEN
jgi:hypothetical protein